MRNLIFISLIFFLGCVKEKREKLVIWESYNDEEHILFMKIVQDFQSKTGIKIDVQRIPFFGMESKILTSLAAKTTPDIARVDIAMVPKLAYKNAIIEITDFNKEEILEQSLTSVEIDGMIYGVPDQVNCLAVFYNKKLFEEKNIKIPENWEEFYETAKRLRDKEKGIYGFAMRNTLWWHLPFFYGFGGKLMEKGRFTLNSTECVNALTFIKKLYDEDIEAGAWKAGAVDPDMGFLNGKYAMVFNGPWKIKSLLDANFPFGIFLIPKGSFGRPTPIGGTDMVIFRNSKNYKNAIKFLQYLTSKEVQTMWANELGEIPVNKMSMNEIDFGKHPYLKVFVEGIKEAVPRPPFPDYQGVENIVNPEIEAALTGKKEIKKALDDATMRVNKEILSIQ